MKKLAILMMFVGLSPLFFAQEISVNDSLFDSDKLFESIKIFPNPTSEILFIRNGELIDSYELFNLQGEVVQKGKSEAQIISLIDVPIGNYFLFIEIDGFYKNYRVSKF
ncbi:MAG: T9SS type A sorting domain-containing protein [Bacteroidota bacterium]